MRIAGIEDLVAAAANLSAMNARPERPLRPWAFHMDASCGYPYT